MKNIFHKSNIPNIITIFRIILIVPLVVLIALSKNNEKQYIYTVYTTTTIKSGPNWCLFVAGILFALAAISDFLDGYLARKYQWVNEFGKLWDPIADKLITNATLISLIYLSYIPFWLLIISLSRDIMVEGFRQYAIRNNIDVSAQKIGKWKTAFQMVGILIIFFISNIPFSNVFSWQDSLYFWILQNGLLIFSLLLSTISGVSYFFNFYINAKKKK